MFWSGVGFLNPGLPESLTALVGLEWSAKAARSYLSYLTVTSSEHRASNAMVVVLAAPCHPKQLHGLTLLADAGLLKYAVLLEQRKPKSSWGVFDSKESSTGNYLRDIGLFNAGWLEWDAGPKSESKLAEILEEGRSEQPFFLVACCRDQAASEEPPALVSERRSPPRQGRLLDYAPGLQTVFGKFTETLRRTVPQDTIFWTPAEVTDLDEFRRQLILFRRIQQGAPGRPILALESTMLPVLYSDVRDWCESPDRDNPIFLVYQSGLPTSRRQGAGGLTDSLLLMSIPGLNIAVPADEEEAATMFEEADTVSGPTAMVFCQSPAVGLSTLSRVNPARGRMLREGKDLALVAIGSTVFPSLLAAESLRSVGLSVAVVDLRYRHPVDRELIETLNRFPLLVAVDEHPEAGGIASYLWRPDSAACKLVRVNIEVDQVLEIKNKMPNEELSLETFGLHAEGIARTVRESLKLAPPTAFG